MIESVMRISAINNLYDKLVILSILICAWNMKKMKIV
jgi:hypothetical protein